MENQDFDFKKSIEIIIKSISIKEEIVGVKNLIDCYNKLCANLFLDNFLEESKKTIVSGGIALSSKHAKDCLEDPIRTARFLKGTYKAILVAKERFENEKITILYAGCGPLGTLIIPLLHLFSSNEIEVIVLDIHQTSIDSVKAIVKKLKYESYIKEYLVADATKYIHSNEKKLHIIVTETMDRALANEPQVEITRNLANQLIDNGIFIPEKIEIQKGYSFFAKEFSFNLKKDILELEKHKYDLPKDKLFTITKDIKTSSFFNYETDWISKPVNFEENPDICLFTEIIIFRDVKLSKSESFITNPICLKSLFTLKNKNFKLKYSTKGIPCWKVIE